MFVTLFRVNTHICVVKNIANRTCINEYTTFVQPLRFHHCGIVYLYVFEYHDSLFVVALTLSIVCDGNSINMTLLPDFNMMLYPFDAWTEICEIPIFLASEARNSGFGPPITSRNHFATLCILYFRDDFFHFPSSIFSSSLSISSTYISISVVVPYGFTSNVVLHHLISRA